MPWATPGSISAPAIIAGPVPTYEYRCEKGHTFEVFQKMADDPVSECVECGAPVERILHPVAVHFKGSGFYSTDYGSKAKSKAAAAESADSNSSSSDSGDSKSSDSSKKSDSKDSGSNEGAKKSEKPAKASSSSSTSSD